LKRIPATIEDIEEKASVAVLREQVVSLRSYVFVALLF
jgi:hypothetical protein